MGVGIVIEVIRKNNSDYDPETIDGPDSVPTPCDPIYLGTLLRLFAKHIPDFMSLIRSSKHTVNDDGKVKSVERGELNSAWGAKIEPLGFDRFKTCELMAELLHCSNMGLLNEPGSDEYVRHRDAERERLIREGAFNPQREGPPGDYNDSTADFTNGSALGSGPPEDLKVLEVTNASEEDGFEDVSSSGVLAEEKDLGSEEDSGQEAETGRKSPNEEQQRDMEPKEGSSEKPKSSTATRPSDPQSPTTSGLSDQVSDIKLSSNRNPSDPVGNEGQPNEAANSPQGNREQDPETSAPMASHPEAVPAPLFACKQAGDSPSEAAGPSEVAPGESAEGTTQEEPPTEGPAELTDPYIQLDTNGQPVVGDYLKIMFVQNQVVPTILVRSPEEIPETALTMISGILLSLSLEQLPPQRGVRCCPAGFQRADGTWIQPITGGGSF